MIRRPRRALPAALVALVGLAASVLLGVSCVQLLLGTPPALPFGPLGVLAAALHWDSPFVVAGEAVLALVGAVLVAASVLPGAPTVLPLRAGAGRGHRIATGATRTSIAEALRVAATDVDGIDRARVRVGYRRVRVKVRTPLRRDTELAGQVESALRERLGELRLTRRPRVRVRLATGKE